MPITADTLKNEALHKSETIGLLTKNLDDEKNVLKQNIESHAASLRSEKEAARKAIMAIEEKNQHSNEALHKCEIKLATSNSEANTAKEQVINIKADLEQKIIENQKTTDELRDEKSLSTGRLSEINILKAELAEVTANDCSEIIQELSNDLASAKTLITELSTEVKTLNKVIDKLNILKSD